MARALADPLDRVDTIRVYNAGADEQKYDSPIAYTFSIATILDELTTPPIAFENGRYIEKAMLSDPEPGKFPRPIGNIVLRHSIHSELGTLAESFRKKGVREVFFKINYEPQAREPGPKSRAYGIYEPRADRGERDARGAASGAFVPAAKACDDEDAEGRRSIAGGRNRARGKAANRDGDGNVGWALDAAAAFRRGARHRLSGSDCSGHAWPRRDSWNRSAGTRECGAAAAIFRRAQEARLPFSKVGRQAITIREFVRPQNQISGPCVGHRR